MDIWGSLLISHRGFLVVFVCVNAAVRAKHCCGFLAGGTASRGRAGIAGVAVFLLCAAAGCGSETERRRGAEGKVTASEEERLKGSDRMWAAKLGGEGMWSEQRRQCTGSTLKM